MTSSTSLFNKGLIISDLKRFWWVSALYGLFLLLLLPFQHLMQKIPANPDRWFIKSFQESLNIFASQSQPQAILICTVPVILAALLWQYLHSSRATAVMHSLPVTRRQLFWTHNAAGLGLLIAPVLVTALALMFLNTTTRLNEFYTLVDILQWLGMTALFNTLLYAITIFVGMFTGSVIAQLAFTYIIQLLPTGLHLLVVENLRYLIYGYTSLIDPASFKYNFPIILFSVGSRSNNPLTAGTVAVYVLIIALILVAAAYVYKLRPAEAAGDVIAFSTIKPVFKYGVTACTMLLFGLYFASASNKSLPVTILGYGLGSFLGYLTAEMLIQKSYKVWSAYKGYLGYLAVMAVLLVVIATDATGYVRRVPAPDQVKNVFFDANIHVWMAQEQLSDQELAASFGTVYGDEGTASFTSPDNIKNIISLHQELVKQPRDKQGAFKYIAYTLNNGGYLVRQYNVDEKQYAARLKPIYESTEYKQGRFPVVNQDPADIKTIELKDHRTSKRAVVLSQAEEIRDFTSRLRQDIMNTTYEDLIARTEDDVYMNIDDYNDKTIRYVLRPNYRLAAQWLKDKGYYDKIVLLPEEIDSVTLQYIYTVADDGAKTPTAKPRQVKITDREVITELFGLKRPEILTDQDKIVDVIFSGNSGGGSFQFSRVIHRDGPASAKLKEYLKQLD